MIRICETEGCNEHLPEKSNYNTRFCKPCIKQRIKTRHSKDQKECRARAAAAKEGIAAPKRTKKVTAESVDAAKRAEDGAADLIRSIRCGYGHSTARSLSGAEFAAAAAALYRDPIYNQAGSFPPGVVSVIFS